MFASIAIWGKRKRVVNLTQRLERDKCENLIVAGATCELGAKIAIELARGSALSQRSPRRSMRSFAGVLFDGVPLECHSGAL